MMFDCLSHDRRIRHSTRRFFGPFSQTASFFPRRLTTPGIFDLAVFYAPLSGKGGPGAAEASKVGKFEALNKRQLRYDEKNKVQSLYTWKFTGKSQPVGFVKGETLFSAPGPNHRFFFLEHARLDRDTDPFVPRHISMLERLHHWKDS
jgi:hypothetical protein